MSDQDHPSEVASGPIDGGEQTMIPVLPLRDVVVYPHMVIPLFVGREKSIRALDQAMEGDKRIMLVAQKSAALDDPGAEDIYEIGTVATILQLLKLPDGTVKVLVEGLERARVLRYLETGSQFLAEVSQLSSETVSERESEVLGRSVLGQFDQYVKLNSKIRPKCCLARQHRGRWPSRRHHRGAHGTEGRRTPVAARKLNVRDRLEKLMGIME